MPFDYYRYTVNSGTGGTNGQVTSAGTLVQVVEADGALTDANGANADTFTIGATTYTFSGGFTNGDFVATDGTAYYYFSSSSTVALGFDVNAQAGFVGSIGATNTPGGSPGITARDNLSITLTCFLPGTLIRTPSGDVAVEKLEIGQLVSLADGRALPVKFVGRQTIAPMFADPLKTAPICIKAGAIDENVPSRDLYTSAGHGMVIDGVLATSAALVNGRSIVRADLSAPRLTYHHIELDEHAVIFANDAPTETFVDNVPREAFDNAAEYTALYGEAKPIVEMALPRAKSARQVPSSIRARLAKRADAIEDAVAAVA